jgi:hypothetical protein
MEVPFGVPRETVAGPVGREHTAQPQMVRLMGRQEWGK